MMDRLRVGSPLGRSTSTGCRSSTGVPGWWVPRRAMGWVVGGGLLIVVEDRVLGWGLRCKVCLVWAGDVGMGMGVRRCSVLYVAWVRVGCIGGYALQIINYIYMCVLYRTQHKQFFLKITRVACFVTYSPVTHDFFLSRALNRRSRRCGAVDTTANTTCNIIIVMSHVRTYSPLIIAQNITRCRNNFVLSYACLFL
jgi:hypothetical protein